MLQEEGMACAVSWGKSMGNLGEYNGGSDAFEPGEVNQDQVTEGFDL